jgi:TusA-related sulfurtransferase
MSTECDPATLEPDHVMDGGDLDCGSGLVLLIREEMLAVPEGGVLEMRSREPTVRDDLPPWCRMVGHEYLGEAEGENCTRYFVKRGENQRAEEEELERDKERARGYEWRVRARASGLLQTTAYCRNFSLQIGQPASFEEKDAHPSAVEMLLSALAGDLVTGFAVECSRSGLEVDDIEATVRGRLGDVLGHLGLSEGDPSFETIRVKCFASTFDDDQAVREAWERVVGRSPVARTLSKATELELKLALV